MTNLWRSIRFTIVFAILLGLIYPLVVTGISNVLFPFQAKGSMVQLNGRIVGSELIAQHVTDPRLFLATTISRELCGEWVRWFQLWAYQSKLDPEVQGNIKAAGVAPGTPSIVHSA